MEFADLSLLPAFDPIGPPYRSCLLPVEPPCPEDLELLDQFWETTPVMNDVPEEPEEVRFSYFVFFSPYSNTFIVPACAGVQPGARLALRPAVLFQVVHGARGGRRPLLAAR